MNPMIKVRDLHKVYPGSRGLLDLLRHPFRRVPGVHALRGIDLDVGGGEIFGLLGPNGAGKTTFLRVLVNLVTPTSGEVTIAGNDLSRDAIAIRRSTSYVASDERSLFWRLSGIENLRFFAALLEIPRREAERRIQHYLDLFGVAAYARQQFGHYSSGRKKIFSIIRGLLASCPVLVLDEPTNSLDPPTVKLLMQYVRDELVRSEHRTVLWSTHRLEEARDFCDQVMLIDQGTCRFQGASSEFSSLGVGHGARTDEMESLLEVFERLVSE